jgi:hypothetical protein
VFIVRGQKAFDSTREQLKGCLHLEAKGRSPKKCSDVIGGNKWYLAFGYILGLGPLFFFQWMKCLCGILGGNFE